MSTDEKANEIIVETQYIQIPDIKLECGELLSSIQIAFETFGKLNSDKSNVILICHALTGDAHVTGKHSLEDKKPGWWHQFVGEGKAIDTNKYFVICSNVLGGCSGSTGPASINPLTGEQYALSFPFITIKDMVRAQKELIDNLGIEKILSCIGGSMGGMQALEWAITFPEKCLSYIILASTPFQSPQNIALNEVGRRAIMNDPNWHNGDYVAHSTKPSDGLSIARMIAHITYLSDQTMHQKFGRRIKGKDKLTFELQNEFEVESYLNYQGRSFIQRFDANSYLYITRAVDYFDYSDGKLAQILSSNGIDSRIKFLIASFSSDWRCPPYQSREIVKALQNNNLPVTYREIESSSGHDSFARNTDLKPNDFKLSREFKLIKDFYVAKIISLLFFICVSGSFIARSDSSMQQNSAQELIEDSAEMVLVKGSSEKRVCPPDFPIKGNINLLKGTKIYHLPAGSFYNRTNPEQCFSNTAEAVREGFRPSER